ncbi:TIGR02452 family protein [Streptomyces somaliensis]|uniref:TIGR02452 family protein n=1 Tax=Streptomyces somaliensis (strain ATCC 33201 / DSM 40738 / JCM 12659 / KCTC 9044 / NCTC 11332 / NRRL B-12077 / IP 733) TaxID=1134445 RepID=A0AA44DGN9_STRE0|nr:TIGR02452 family protein [Streptomyces somaliensis]NKY16457.1 TIGR02452 family protein [Streptomyces somaliensis DSM 40738]
MSARLREIARQTEEIVSAGRYRVPGGEVHIAESVARALAGTTLHGPEPVPATPDTGRTTRIEVTGESSTQAARRLADAAPGEPVSVLNFASARNPGGGYLNGAQAQEEALCRASALHATLLRAPEYYEHHRADRDPFYTDRVIHSPGVPVFRDDRGHLLDRPYTVGFLTSPAPNAGVIRARTPERAARVPAALASRAERVLETAVAHGYRRLVLGAWGCGVFRNDPADVAGAFRALLTGEGRFAGHFDEVVFGVLDRTREGRTSAAFRAAFAAGQGPRSPVRDAAGARRPSEVRRAPHLP